MPISKGQAAGATAVGAGLAAVAAAAAAAAATATAQRQQNHPPDDAPGRTAKDKGFRGFAVTGRTVTINRPRSELYAFWRDFGNLATFMENVEAIQPTGGDRAVWTIKAPAGQTVDVETRIVTDRPDELIAWRSLEGSRIETEGRVAFRDAGGERGTIVELIIAYRPPAGAVGQAIAKLFQREPNIQARHELKRLKMLMETGEIAIAKPGDRDADPSNDEE